MAHIARSPKQLGALIHNARTKRNLTQQALAALVGTGQKTISRIESGQTGTKLDTLFGILAALDLDEPPRVCRRLQLLRRWSLYEQDDEQVCA